jgi:S1-C subfamily serine protease
MKTTLVVYLLFCLMLGIATAEQTNSLPPAATVGDLTKMRTEAENGNVLIQSTLALFLNSGDEVFPGLGFKRDPHGAAKWYLRAAWQGDAEAQISIAELYAKSEGVGQDFVEAYKWFNIAAASTEKTDWHVFTNVPTMTSEQIEYFKRTYQPPAMRAKAARDQLAQYMTLDQIAEAQQLARDFKPRKESEKDLSPPPDKPRAFGTGFSITDDGYLISNFHVVKDAAQIRLLTSAGNIPAKVVKVDVADDLALLKAEGKFSPLPIVASRTVRLGSTVATVGFPNIGLQGFSPKLAKGEIAALAGATDDARYFQISVPVQPGNSGGALVDEHGNVVGIVSAKLDAATALVSSGALPENVN